MHLTKILPTLFYLSEIIEQQNYHPNIYWIVYLATTLHLFLQLEVNESQIFLQIQKNIFYPTTYFSQTSVFAFLIICAILEILLVTFLVFRNYRTKVKKSAFENFLIKTVFYLSFINFTINVNFLASFSSQSYKIVVFLLFGVCFLLNILIHNFTLGSKRIWGLNALFMVDFLRIFIVFADRNQVFIIMCLAFVLVTLSLIIYFRPIFHLSSQNNLAMTVIALNLFFSVYSLAKIIVPKDNFNNFGYQIIFGMVSIWSLYLMIQKWVDSKINKTIEVQSQPNLENFDLKNMFFLKLMEQNFDKNQNSIKGYLINHKKKCKKFKCACSDVENYLFLNQFGRGQDKKSHTKSTQKSSLGNDQTKILFKNSIQHFVLCIFDSFIENQIKFFQTEIIYNKYSPEGKPNKKEVSFAQKRQVHSQNNILHLLKLQKLIQNTKNLNKAYLHLTELQLSLRTYDILSSQNMGILNFLKAQIVEKKSIALESAEANVNKFCIKYFHSQKVTNKLQEVILKAVNEAKQFWKEVRIKEPDTHKILSIMSRFNKHHDKVMEIYSQVEHDKERQTMEVRMLFKFYERILQLEGNARFFKDSPLTDDKVNDLKNANALNLKLYSDESNTQVMSFSINEEDFGKIRYRSSSFQSLIDPSFVNINDFLLQDCVSSHNRAVKRFLEEDNNYYKHTETSPCYIRVSDKVIKPVYLEVHLMTSWTLNEIEMAAFLKPLIDDERLMEKGTCRNFKNTVEQSKVVVLDEKGAFMAYTKSFQFQKQSMFQDIEAQSIFNPNFLDSLEIGQYHKLQLTDSDYKVSLLKKIFIQTYAQNGSDKENKLKFLYFILFEEMFENWIIQQDKNKQTKQLSIKYSLKELSSRRKKTKHFNLQKVLMKSLDTDLANVQKYDETRQKIGKIFNIAIHPQSHAFKPHWKGFTIFFTIIFFAFMTLTTIFLLSRKQQFTTFNSFMRKFSQNQIAITQSIFYLRQIHINLYNGINIELISTIVTEVQRLNGRMYSLLDELRQYYDQIWTCMDVLDYGPRIIRQEKAYIVVNNFILSSITNLLQSLKIDSNLMKFPLLQSEFKVPYTSAASSFLKLINNGVSFVLPASMSIRSNALNEHFIPNMKEIKTKPFFYVPITGIFVCLILIFYDFYLSTRLHVIASSSFDIFSKLKISFSDEKLSSMEEYQTSLKYKDILKTQTSMSDTKKAAWKNLNSLFSKTSTIAFGTLILNTNTIKSQEGFKTVEKNIHVEQTGRELMINNDSANFQQYPQKNTMQANSILEDPKASDKDMTIDPNKFIEMNSQKIQIQKKCQFIGYLWIILPVFLYFTHIFVISTQFNGFMEFILSLQNNLYYRKQNYTYMKNYQYELSLYEVPYGMPDAILKGIDEFYESQKMIKDQEDQMKEFMFGKMTNYKLASDLLSHRNICSQLQLFQNLQPSFGIQFSQQQCQTISDGILTAGFRQAQVYGVQFFRSFVLQNKRPHLLSVSQHYALLNDDRIQKFNKLYPYLYSSSQYIIDAFEKDFQSFITLYEIFIMVDTPILVFVSVFMVWKYFKLRKITINKNLSIIKCTFLLIGQKKFYFDTDLLKDEVKKDDGERFYFLN